jgi:hypothetical protein
MSFLELRIPPVALTLLFSFAMYGLSWGFPGALIDIPCKAFLAISVAAAGGLVALAGVAEFQRRNTTVNPMSPQKSSSLVSSGIYA